MIDTRHLEHVNDVVAGNLRALKAWNRVTDDQIAAEVGKTRSWVQERMTGSRECKGTDLARFALYFGVPIARLFDDPVGTATSSCSAAEERAEPGARVDESAQLVLPLLVGLSAA